jgi:hypothetical protein
MPVAALVDDYVYGYHHRSFPVTRRGVLLGWVGTEQVSKLDRSEWSATPVERITLPYTAEDVVGAETDALAALDKIHRGARSLWIVTDGRLVGVPALRDMLEPLAVRLQLGRHGSGRCTMPWS